MQARVVNDVLPPKNHQQIHDFLNKDGWVWGWKSQPKTDMFAFWHKHFAGALSSDHEVKQYDCAEELRRFPPLLAFWQFLSRGILKQHRLTRCYANAFAYGNEGQLHTDAVNPQSFTSIYYPQLRWSPNWGGETLLFNKEETDIIGCVYPKPNRLFVFQGITPHVGRGCTRVCPMLRVTLMFKTEWFPSTEPKWSPAATKPF
jgi:SM-20-related protein